MPKKRRKRGGPKTSGKKPTGADPSPVLAEIPDKVLIKHFSSPSDLRHCGIRRTPLVRNRPVRHRGGKRPAVLSGFFDVLPVDIIHLILYKLDCRSLARLAATNSAIESFIKDQPYYSFIVEYCLHAIIPAQNICTDSYFTVKRFYDVFKTPHCAVCGKISDFILVPDCQRICTTCFHRRPDSLLLEPLDVAAEQFRIDRGAIPGNFRPLSITICSESEHRRFGDAAAFVFVFEALNLARRQHGDDFLTGLTGSNFGFGANISVRTRLGFIDPDSNSKQQVEFGRRCVACLDSILPEAEVEEVNEDDGETESDSDSEWESESSSPTSNTWNFEPIDRIFTARSLIEHIRSGECRRAQKHWKKVCEPLVE